MATKTISLTAGAYARLDALKRDGESFSDVVDRLTGKFALLEIVRVLSGDDGKHLKAARRSFGKRF
jgi:predicted CopG family antitoxin